MSSRGSPESRSHSPDGSLEKRPSKKRKVLSCFACRNRKMKCDRVYPVCGRCARTGRADQCTYDPRLLEELNVNDHSAVNEDATQNISSSSDSLAWRLRTQQRRIEMLERQINRKDEMEEDDPSFEEPLMFRGKGFKTHFYGSTSPLSLLNQYTELQQFTILAMSIDSSIGRIRGDFKSFRSRRKEMLKKRAQPLGTDAEILGLIPERAAVESDCSLYFDTFESTYRVFHEQTFWRDLGIFWEKRDQSSPGFAVALVLIMACVRCLYADHEPVFIGDSSYGRETASNWIDICDAWIRRQNRKHLTLEYYQLLCLSLIAKRANCIQMKQDWTHSGDLLRLAMSGGLHRNPERLPKGLTSVYEMEMRKRLWGTIMELELQSSIDAGLQSSLCGLYFDSPAPVNINDDALDPNSTQVPVGTNKFTTCSYLHWSMKSLPLRVHLMKLLNDPTSQLRYSDVLHYDAQINKMLSSLPEWDSPDAAVPQAILDLQLRQFLLILHQPYANLSSTNSRYTFSFTACINAGNSILGIHDKLTNAGIYVLNHLRHDLFRTGMTISHTVYHNAIPPVKQETNGTPVLQIPQLPAHDFIFANLCSSTISLMEKAFSMFEKKLMRLGTGYLEFWLLAAAIGIMPASSSSGQTNSQQLDELHRRCRIATDRVTNLCFKVLALQKDPENQLASSLRTTIATASPSSVGAESQVPHVGVGMNGVPPNISGSMNVSAAQAPPIDVMMGGGLNGLAAAAAGQGLAMPIQGMGPAQMAGFAQGMQNIDLSGWNFPDFWAFDVGEGF